MMLARHRKIGRKTPASANKWGRYLRALLTFAAGRYTDSEGRPILTDNAVNLVITTERLRTPMDGSGTLC